MSTAFLTCDVAVSNQPLYNKKPPVKPMDFYWQDEQFLKITLSEETIPDDFDLDEVNSLMSSEDVEQQHDDC